MSIQIVRWLPRVVALLFTLFISLFAFDVNEQGPVKLLDQLMHLLPTLFCAIVIVIAWKREWFGALIFLAAALEYGWWAREHAQWILVIAGPMLLLTGLYTWAWLHRRRTLAR